MKSVYLWIMMLAGVAACTQVPVQPANVIIQDAHGGGSRVVFNGASTVLASGGWDGELRLWRLPHGEPLHRWHAHRGTVNGIAFLDNDTRILTAGYDGYLRDWNAKGGLLRQARTPSPIRDMRVDEARDVIITGHDDGAVRLWRLRDFSLEGEHRLYRDYVRTLAWHGPGEHIAAGGDGDRVFVWRRGAAPAPVAAPHAAIYHLEFSPDGRRLTGSGWFRLFQWSLDGGVLRILDTEHAGIIASLQYSGDGKTLASISRQTDSAVYFLDPNTGAVTQRFQPHDLCGAGVNLSPDGRYLATTSDDASVRIWDFEHLLPSRVF